MTHRENNKAEVQRMIDKDNSKLDQRNQGATPLHIAAQLDYLDILAILLHNRADKNVRNNRQFLTIDVARSFDHLEAAKLLEDASTGVVGAGLRYVIVCPTAVGVLV